ncbi:TIGR00366 family protein [Marinobacter sp. 1-3A]|uniref:TIGR00366 family protein n=1 Tax=Marinobacter sp. 1-3A TaxID=2582920 RepID=UPI0019043CCB|nr:TIGR00366 family protein [Marinobacter sp. 1-3A]MBK1875050.1 TIGR00366 family protein [Marinobacter sp. 1-3A]
MRALVTFFTNLVHRYMPDAFVIAIALTLLTIGLAVVAEGVSVAKAVTLWGDGFWSLLSFAMQMAIILISGYVLAKTPLVDRFLDAITSKVTSPRKAIVIATLAGAVFFKIVDTVSVFKPRLFLRRIFPDSVSLAQRARNF